MERFYMKKETEEWIKIALEEYKSALCLFNERLYRMVCYHAQQSVEKVLKAVLIENNVDVARTHNIIDLKNSITKIGYAIELSSEDAIFLNSIYRSRYPANIGLLPLGEPTKEDAEKAISIAKPIIEAVQKLLQ